MKKLLFLSLLFVLGLNNSYAQIISVYETPKGDTYYSLDELIASGADTARAVRATNRDYSECSWQTEWLPVWSHGLIEEFLWFASFDMEKNNSRSLSDSVWIENITFLPNAGIKVKIGYTSATTENWFRFNFGTLSFGVNQYNSISYYTDTPGVNYVEIEHHDNLVVGQTYYIKAFQHWPQILSGRVLTFTMQLPTDPCTNFHPSIFCGDTTLCEGESTTLTSSNGASYHWSNGGNTKSITVNTSGIYTVTVTDASGCTGTDRVAVVVDENPDVFILTAQQTGMMGMSDMVSVMGPDLSPFLFHWDKSTSPNPTILVTEEGTYTVTVTNENTWCMTVLSTDVGFMECPNVTTVDTFVVIRDTCINDGNVGGLCNPENVLRSHDRDVPIKFCAGDPILTLKATVPGSNPNTVYYEWTGQGIVGNTNKSSINIFPTHNQTYTLAIVLDQNDGGCTFVEVFDVVMDCSTANQELDPSKITISSNEGAVRITTDFDQYQVTLIDVAGREVKNQSCNQTESIISVDDLASGLYAVRIFADNKMCVKPIVVTH